MKIRTIYCLEDESLYPLLKAPEFYWGKVGEAEGNNLQECCDNLAKKNHIFAQDYNPKTLRYGYNGGDQLGLVEDVAKWVMLNLNSETWLGLRVIRRG